MKQLSIQFEPRTRLANFGLVVGPITALVAWMLLGLTNAPLEARTAAGLVVLMAAWWMTEALPLAVTALIPLIAGPLLPIYPSQPRVGELVKASWEATTPTGSNVTMMQFGTVAEVKEEGVRIRLGESSSAEASGSSVSPVGQSVVGGGLSPLIPFRDVEPTDRRSAFQKVAEPFADRFIFLFLGGFCIALSIERWNLHRRIALGTLRLFGSSPQMIIAGFMCATAFLSMWISNTATAVMMLPIAMSVVHRLINQSNDRPESDRLENGRLENGDQAGDVSAEAAASDTAVDDHTKVGSSSSSLDRDQRSFAVCLLLAIAYSASVGGVATLVGTPPNALLASFLSGHDRPISFVNWMMFATPIALVLLVVVWLVLTKLLFRFRLPANERSGELIRSEFRQLGKMSNGEWTTLVVFALTAMLWIFRKPLADWEALIAWLPAIARLDDSMIALIGAISLFMIPVSFRPLRMAMDWTTAKRLPWGILLLFGGGLALARIVQASGLGELIGTWLESSSNLPMFLMIALTALVVVFLTEFTSNMATTALFLPILFELAGSVVGIDGSVMPAEYLLVVATLSASCAFMLPVATPPNAIVFASEQVTIPDMARAGFVLNLIAVAVLPVLVLLLVPRILGI